MQNQSRKYIMFNCLMKTSEIERSSVFDWPYFLCELDFVRSFLAIEVSIEFD